MVKRSDWKISDMPSEYEKFVLNVSLLNDYVEKLKEGHLPIDSEDNWFTYSENSILYIHDSKTGCCIYIVPDLKAGQELDVIVNSNKNQYNFEGVAEEKLKLLRLLTDVLIEKEGVDVI